MAADIEIARNAKLEDIRIIGEKLGLTEAELSLYGKHKAKIELSAGSGKDQGKLILVTALSPTPAGEGKTTTSIGLAQGLNQNGKQATVVLREPSLGPVFGIKGGAAGGGHSQVVPMEDINLHFTGDFAAVEKAHNLLAALVDNYLHFTNSRDKLDARTILWKRVMDMNDRALRQAVVGLGGKTFGVPRQTGFDITAASEIMAILCLADDRKDLKARLARILVGTSPSGEPFRAGDLNAAGAMAALLKDAIKPNLVQTLENTPAIIHGGPFANIAQGTNTVIATRLGLRLSDYVVTEAGFGSDLGAEKFLNIKCVSAGLNPDAVVVVATVRALKYHGGVPLMELDQENPGAVVSGLDNLHKHVENMGNFGLPVVVALNAFSGDSKAETDAVLDGMKASGTEVVVCEAWARGGEGAKELAAAVADAADSGAADFKPLYDWTSPIKTKIQTIAQSIYGASGVTYANAAEKAIAKAEDLGLADLPICMAKTQKSFSDDASKVGRPTDFTINVRELEIAAGAGFLVPITGAMLRMPGLPRTPSAVNIDIDDDGNISGLF